MEIIKVKGYNTIYALSTFKSDYRKMFSKSENEYDRHLRKLRLNLNILDEKHLSVLNGSYPQFEKLTNENLYSIRHITQMNPRVIFAYVSEENNILLLTCTLEKSSSDYASALAKAKSALKTLGVKI